MNLYLDNCCFNRPFDDQSSLTVRLETEAKLSIQERIKSKEFKLAWSYILDFENNANPFIEKRSEIQRWKNLAESFTNETQEILITMKKLTTIGLKPVDALHISCATFLQCDVFITVDKGIIKKANKISQLKIMSPIDFMIEWEANNEN
jgi:hypothetical protein